MTETERAIEHFEYGISHDIFSEPVTGYARLAVAALTAQQQEIAALKAENEECQRKAADMQSEIRKLDKQIAELTARAEKAEKERDELKALCRPVCPVCGLKNDRHFQGILCDRCGANLRGPQEAGKGEAPNE